MINPAVEYGCEAFSRAYDAPNIMAELNGNNPEGHYTSDALTFALLFPDSMAGIERYSRQDLTLELVWFVAGYLGKSGPSINRRQTVRSWVDSGFSQKVTRARLAHERGIQERQRILDQIQRETTSNSNMDLEERLPN